MKIVFIGAGNLATHLAEAFYKAGHTISQIFSRTEQSAVALATSVNANPITSVKQITGDADLYVFSVKDAVLPQLLSEMPATKGVWVHTAGSIPMDIFRPYTNAYGVFYPLQTFSKSRKVDFLVIPVFLEASSDTVYEILQSLALEISGKVSLLSSDKRKMLHLSAVFACNFTNHMYVLADKLLSEEGIDPRVLIPLIDETAAKIHDLSPLEAQTGPAVRYDMNVIEKHQELLKDERLRSIYSQLSKSIHIEAINNK